MSSKAHKNHGIYLDNGATSFPKPPAVAEAVGRYITEMGGNPGRSGHSRSIEAGEIVFSAREALAGLFGITNPMHVIFCFNATDALNLAIQGMAGMGDHVITTSMEHNSSIRPLKELEKLGRISVSIVQCTETGHVRMEDFEDSIGPKTRLAVINHGSNVFGTVQPLRDIGEMCRKKGIVLIADCAQTAGTIPVNMVDDCIDLLAFAGHKGLYGPTGTGGLVISDDFDHGRLPPLKYGGTGSYSDKIEQPEFIPDKYESGTLNVAGISGLLAGINYIFSLQGGTGSVYKHKKDLIEYFQEKAESDISGFLSYIKHEYIETGTIAFNIEGVEPSEISGTLSEKYGIMCRDGLHCAPLAHKTMGTFPGGTVRFGFGAFNSREDVDAAVAALAEIEGVVSK